MVGFIARRLLAGVLTLFAIATLCFFITRLAPGNPFSGERQLTKEAMESVIRTGSSARPGGTPKYSRPRCGVSG